MMLLMGLALLVIAALLLLFTRSLFDLLMSLLGLVLTIVWMMGAQGWLGPNGLGVIGPPNILTTMVPIMLIGLVVDYAIQTVGRYREQRNEGRQVEAASRLGLRSVIIPLSLAAVTTVVAFLTNLTSAIPAYATPGGKTETFARKGGSHADWYQERERFSARDTNIVTGTTSRGRSGKPREAKDG